MLPFNAEFQSGKSKITQVRLDVLLTSGVLLNMTEENVMLGGFTRDTSTTVDGQFTVGAAVTGKITVVIDNSSNNYSMYDFRGARITASLGGQLSDGTYQLVQVGIYTADEYSYDGSNITLTAYDNLCKFDIPCGSTNTQPTFPATVTQLINYACSVSGVTLANTSIPNGSYTVTNKPKDWETMTWHDVVAYCAQIACCFAKILPDGKLLLSWYDTGVFDTAQLDGGTFSTDSTPYSDGAIADGGDFTYTDTDIYNGGHFGDRDDAHLLGSLFDLSVNTDDVQITGVSVALSAMNNIYATDDTPDYVKTLGTEDYLIRIENNPLIERTNDADSVCSYIYDLIVGMRFRPLNASILENPSVEAGDAALVFDRLSNTYTCFLSHVTYTTNASTSVSCDSVSTMQNLKARYGESEKTRALAKRVFDEAISNAEDAMFTITTAVATTMGLYPYPVSDGQGGTIYIFGNKDTLAASDIRWKFTAGALLVSNDYGATWNGAITAAGQAVLQEVYAVKVNADNIIAGVFSVSKNGTEVFHADTDTGIVRIAGDAEFSGKLNAATGNFKGALTAEGDIPSSVYTYRVTIADNSIEGSPIRVEKYGPSSIDDRSHVYISPDRLRLFVSGYDTSTGDFNGTLSGSGGVFTQTRNESGVEYTYSASFNPDNFVTNRSRSSSPYENIYYGIQYNGPFTSSDRRIKENILEIPIDIAKSLKPCKYQYKGCDEVRYGFIAQEVQEIMPDAVVEDDNGYLSLNYEQMIAPLYALVQEQQTRIDELENRIDRLEALIKQIAPKEV